MSDRFHSPFASLGKLPGMPAPETAAETRREPVAPASERGPARAVVRMERAGRGGKVVTVIDHLALPEAGLRDWLKALKAALGCGGAVEGTRIVLQGDHRDRAVVLLRDRGVRKVVIG